jgi:fibronectin type 3 domain-containing protein
MFRSLAVAAVLIGGSCTALQGAGYILTKAALRWNQNPEPDIVGYRVYYGSQSANYTNSVSVGMTNATMVKGLVVGQTYYFMVTAVNSKGVESLPSRETAKTVTLLRSPLTVPLLTSTTTTTDASPADTAPVDTTPTTTP